MTQKHPSIAIVVTVFNEERTIGALVASLATQTLSPLELCIVDGGSTDATLATLKKLQKIYPMTVIAHKGNRSVCRNRGVAAVKTEWVAVTDAGCRADSKWLSEMWRSAEESKADCVAGNAVGAPTTPLESASIPFVLVMPDVAEHIAEHQLRYLPATRSLLIKRALWLDLGGLPEQHRYSEDYIFAQKLVDPATRFEGRQPRLAFAPRALVYWQPPSTLNAFARMIREHAEGDAYAGLTRPKVWLVLGRYVCGALLISLWIARGFPLTLTVFLLCLFVAYLFWAKHKHARYVEPSNWWSPVSQLAADVAVCAGTIRGLGRRLFDKKR